MTCTLFSYIVETIAKSKNKKYEIPCNLSHFTWLQYINNKNKFVTYNEYIKNTNGFLYSPEEYKELFFKIQRIYFSIIRFKQIFKFKYYKNYDYEYDLIGNKLSTLKDKHKIKIIENKTLYTFSIKDLINNICNCLTENSGMFWEPKFPTNPYTGLPISKNNLYNIYFAYKETNIHTNLLFEYFFLSEFNISHFTENYEGITNSYVIESAVRNLMSDDLRTTIREMFRMFRFKPPEICDNFPNDRLKDIFTPYLNLYYHYKYGQDENRKHHSKNFLREQLRRFNRYKMKHNPNFGRIILRSTTIRGSRKRKYTREVMDDCVRWDPRFPYINEKKPVGFQSVLHSTFDSSFNSTNVSQVNTINNNIVNNTANNERDNHLDTDSSSDSDSPIILTEWRSPMNNTDVTINDLSLNDTPQITPSYNFNIASTRERSSERTLFSTALNFLNRRRGNEMNDQEFIQNSSITSLEELNSILNISDNEPIRRANIDIARNSIMSYLIRLRLLNIEGTSVENNAISLIDELLSKQLEIIVGKLLLSYIGREINNDVTSQVVREILAEPFISRIENENTMDGYNVLRESMHSLYQSIVVDTSDLSNNIV